MVQIRIENLTKSFGAFNAVDNLSVTIEDGDFFCLLGPSGCGKTTTLRMIAGLELPTSGQIMLGGDDVSFKRASERDIAFVFQLFALYPHMNVRSNLAYPLRSAGLPRREIKARVEEAARILRIGHVLDRPVSGLPGGDRQRVALGRAIVRHPKAFLMDEPLGALDAELRHLMCGELRQLHDRLRATTVYVTHDQLEAMSMGDVIAVMNKGRIEQLGRPQDLYDRPASVFSASFIGSPPMNFFPFQSALQKGTDRIEIDGALLGVPRFEQDLSESELLLGVRPEHIRFSDSSSIRGEIFGAEYLGATQIVTVTTKHGRVKARMTSNTPIRPGEQVGLAFRGEKLSVFDKSSGRVIPSALHEVAHG